MMYEQPVVLRWGSPGEFLKLFFPKSTESRISEDWRVQKLRNLIDSNPAGVRCLDEICRQLGLCISGRQARRLFKACTGLGIKEYIKKRRLDLDARQLRTTDAPVKEVAIEAAYGNVRNFNNGFLNKFHQHPND